MKILKSSLMCLSIMLVLSACTSTDDAKKKEQIDKVKKIKDNLARIVAKDKLAAKKFAQSQADNYYKALRNKDYASFCKSKKMSKKKFNKWHKAVTKRYGTLKSQKYVGSISNPLVVRYMWKWNFTRKTKSKTFTREALYNVFIAKDKETNKYILFTTGLQ